MNDQLNLLRKLTARKLLNAAKLYGSYFLSRWTKKNFHWGLPFSLALEPTTSCNLRCPECPSGLRAFTRPTGMLQEKLFREAIDELSSTLLYLTFYFQGEPFLNPSFLEMVQYASSKNIYTATSTNAHYLNDAVAKKTVESGLDRLIISIDGTTQETYQSYRIGGKLEKVIEGTKNMVKWKQKLQSATPRLVFQFLVVKPNEHQLEEARQLAKDLGVDEITFKTAQIYDYENGSPLIPTLDKYSRYAKQSDGTYRIKNKLENSCWKMWHSCVITWDGNVVPCCFDKDAHYQLGNMQKGGFEKVWRSAPYNRFRKQLLKARSEIDICKNCTEGMKIFG
ncbi:SPASM domain-containing protein [Limibacter armeniacum]|uniref:radical SAM/SPASM domain-containing protein n=1 Tax=Limibacter armeniacum TaxID=466084 RepID=UPI002FE6767A